MNYNGEVHYKIQISFFPNVHGTFNRDILKFFATVRLIETVRKKMLLPFFPIYGTFNRDILENFATVRLIEQYV